MNQLGSLICAGEVGCLLGMGVAWLIMRPLFTSLADYKMDAKINAEVAKSYENAALQWQKLAMDWKSANERLEAYIRSSLEGDNNRPTLH